VQPAIEVWVFHSADRVRQTARSRAEEIDSRLKVLGYRELDLVSRLAVLYERAELYPREVTKPQVAELNRKLDEIRAEIETLRAVEPRR
jgi:hypothetical protein